MSEPRPPKSPKKGKYVNIRIVFLNDTVHIFQLATKGSGGLLWGAVVSHLQLLESDYFDLEFTNQQGDECWLEKDKSVLKQIGSSDTPLRFCVKFYTPDPGLLEDELTRFLFALQVRKDLVRGELKCSENTSALLASYVVQGEIGDFDPEEYPDPTYLTIFKFLPEHLQTHEFMAKVRDYHRQHIGESPSESDLNLLDTARKVELYGVKMQPSKDHEGVTLRLAVAHLGVLVFQQQTKINTFSWAKVRKLSFKRKRFLIKLHADTYGYYKDTVEFFFENRDRCKLFWKRCIEHHAFFRCQAVAKPSRNKSRVVSRGSSFRYNGRTQKQLMEFVRENIGKTRPHFERSTSGRISSRSASMTPKISKPPMHSSSADLHTSSGSRSSGSHILDSNHTPSSGLHSTPQSAVRVESVDVHSDSSMSGSRSLNSPRLEHGLSLDQEVVEAVNARTEGAASDEEDEDDQLKEEEYSPQDGLPHVASDSRVASLGRPVPGLDRMASAPSFGLRSQQAWSQAQQAQLGRTAEIDNIPEVLEEPGSGFTPPRFGLGQPPSPPPRQDVYQDIDDLPPPPPTPPPLTSPSPPPPPPPFEEDLEEDDRPLPPALGQQDQEEEEAGLGRAPALQSSGFNSHETSLDDGRGVNDSNDSPPWDGVRGHGDQEDEEEECRVDAGGDISGVSVALSSPANSSVRALSQGSILSAQEKEEEGKRKGRHRPTDTAYYIAKEMLMTERTYKKDLEVLCVWFRNAVSCESSLLNQMSEVLFSWLDPIYNFHYGLLKDLEMRMVHWEGKNTPSNNTQDSQKIGDILLRAINTMHQLYEGYFEHLEQLLQAMDSGMKRQHPLEELVRTFEGQKVCYLPLNTFFLRPGQRLLHFKLVLERLVKHYPFTHHDTEDCKEALCRVVEIITMWKDKFTKMENLQKLMELQRDLLGLENLVHPDRDFVREGCLQKFSRKGYQQRMFFLFSDMLVYTSRTSASLLQFKVHGQLPLRGMTVEETDQTKSAVLNSFAIYAGNKYILVAAGSQEEKDKWIEDITQAVLAGRSNGPDRMHYPSLKASASSSENVGGGGGDEAIADGDQSPQDKPVQHRTNTSRHVCWHRNTSVSMRDHQKALRNQLSGYLLRKFKTSNGWQKLWVVFTNFCLFFYKTYQDDFPLASLPLLGYAVNTPEDDDGIHKEHVFKLQFKNHVYFFRAESEYTFYRWMEVINSATHNARRTRLFSRLDSKVENSSS